MSAASPTHASAPDATSSPLASAPREIEHLFQLSLFLLIITGFGTLAATGKLDLFSLACVLGALTLRGILLLRDKPVAIPRRIASWLAVVYLLIFVVDFFFFSARDFVTPAVHLVLFGMCVKLFNIERERDYVYLALLSFLMVLSAAILTVDYTFLAAFGLFLVLAVFWFMVMELRRSAIAAPNRATLAIPGRPKRRRLVSPLHRLAISLTRSTIAMVIGIAATATVLFFAMPRISGGYISRRVPTDAISVGYSDTVDLGVIGRIQQSSEVVAHLQIEGDTTGDRIIRLRGSALTHFDGKRWTNPQREAQVISRAYGRVFQLSTRAPELRRRPQLLLARGVQPDLLRYRILMEPTSSSVIFTIPAAQAVYGPFREIAVDDDLTFRNLDGERTVTSYEGVSDVSVPLPTVLARMKDLAANGAPRSISTAKAEENLPAEPVESFAERYLQLPDPLDPRIPELAGQLTASQPNTYLRALAVERYLTTRYGYTLQLPARTPADPIADFLFSRRVGHCEYFASAMAVLLRSVGIPSRVVNGFRGGQFNQINATYIVRGSNAHSWVEAFIPGAGWIAFDPTPGSGRAPPPASFWSRAQLYLDASREFWREWVVNYDAGHQQTLSLAAARRTRNDATALRLWAARRYRQMLEHARRFHRLASHNPRQLLWRWRFTLWMLLAFALTFAGLRVRARWRAESPRLAPHSAATAQYLRMARRLARRGYARAPGQTPSEFAASIPDASVRDAVLRFTTAYERARFGGSPDDAAQLRGLLDQIRTALSRS
jgi:protein-glutamine gamma-glutamyltransferase